MKHPSFSTTSLAASFAVLSLLAACTASVTPGTGSGTNTTGYSTSSSYDQTGTSSSFMTVSDLVAQLNAQGINATLGTNRVQQPFFSGNGQEVQVNGETIQIYQYSNAASAQSDANTISNDGMSVNGTQVSWAGPPHFFLKDNLLVLYVGSNPQMLNTLQSALGVQLAGASDTTGTNVGTGATMSTSTSGTNFNSSY
ncbi:MAG TPA: hypothetical protein VHA78_03715 [Candidatus Peribacteraceae bacterium]|nr:hypothetical protein [Candidatus Peribacteraceae bacterium]